MIAHYPPASAMASQRASLCSHCSIIVRRPQPIAAPPPIGGFFMTTSPDCSKVLHELLGLAYDVRNLCHHSIAAGAFDMLRSLLRQQTELDTNAWFALKFSAGLLRSFFDDLSLVLQQNSLLRKAGVPFGRLTIAVMFRYQLRQIPTGSAQGKYLDTFTGPRSSSSQRLFIEE